MATIRIACRSPNGIRLYAPGYDTPVDVKPDAPASLGMQSGITSSISQSQPLFFFSIDQAFYNAWAAANAGTDAGNLIWQV